MPDDRLETSISVSEVCFINWPCREYILMLSIVKSDCIFNVFSIGFGYTSKSLNTLSSRLRLGHLIKSVIAPVSTNSWMFYSSLTV